MKLNKNDRILFGGAVIVGLMIGLSFASVPLYRIFCGATGFGGTTQNAAEAPARPGDRYVTVSLDGSVDSSLPWDFAPEVRSVRVRLGEPVTVKYHAHNRSNVTTVGTAVHNVQPDKAGYYFDKIQCFCFTRQTLKPGESRELPVLFYVDPAMAEDHRNDDVKNITLSYTFFLAKDQVARRP